MPNSTITMRYEDATHLKQLVELKGALEAARMLSLSDSSVSEMKSKDKVRPVYDIAARALLADVGHAETTYLVFCRVPKRLMEPFQMMCRGMSIPCRSFAD